jgi:hypothetical protein
MLFLATGSTFFECPALKVRLGDADNILSLIENTSLRMRVSVLEHSDMIGYTPANIGTGGYGERRKKLQGLPEGNAPAGD